MNPPEEDRLLRDVLADEALERVRAASLTAGVTAVRRRRHRRAIAAGAAGCLMCAVLAFVLFVRREQFAPAPTSPTRATPSSAPAGPKVKWIDDAQLFARFPDRGIALIGRPGEQRLVFLDPTAAK